MSPVVSCVSVRAEGGSHLHAVEAPGSGNQGLFFEQSDIDPVPECGTMSESQAWVATPCLVLD